MNTQIPKPLSISLAVLALFQGLSFAHADITDLPDLSPDSKTYTYQPPKTEAKKPEVLKPKPVVKAPSQAPKKNLSKTPTKVPTKPQPKPEQKKETPPVKVKPAVIPIVGKRIGYMNRYEQPDAGTIQEIYENGMVLLKNFSGEMSVVENKNLYNFNPCNSTGTSCIGTRVLFHYNSYYPGKIIGYFGDRYILVQNDDNPNEVFYADPEAVSILQSCGKSRKICVGDSVVYVGPYSVYFGKAETILPDGKITVRYENNSADTFEEELVYKTTLSNCAERICANDRVLLKDSYGYYPAKVLKIYDGTIFVVQKDGEKGQTFTKANLLSKTK